MSKYIFSYTFLLILSKLLKVTSTLLENIGLPKEMTNSAASKYRAPLYVLIFGVLFGATISMAKVAANHGIQPLSLVFWQMLAGGLLLALTAAFKKQPLKFSPRYLRYYFVAGILGNALPTTLAFTASIKIGAALTGLVYPLSPVFTYAFSLIMRLDRIRKWKIIGMLFGLFGALIIVLPPMLNKNPEEIALLPPLWILLAFTIPVFLGLGNIYRSIDWPAGSASLPLAAGMLIATSILLLPALLLTDAPIIPRFTSNIQTAILTGNIIMSYVGFIFYFELQRIADPVYFSQISYFITITTLFFGYLVFGESFELYILPSIVLMFMGLYLVSRGQ
ncbi:hypothetical protein A9Q83_09890 [Alphaproteobacteria bacterium 46_93_T64]|nr:hypothetical protein A9Q83_09890 [Alphaproteobacteria bacterium 46_93_T64]